MNKTIAMVTLLLAFSVHADDNNVTNSNNSNYSTTTQTIDETNNYDNSGQDHSDRSSSIDSSMDSSTGDNRNNWSDSSTGHNQTSTTNQDINNSVTKTVDTGGGNFVDGNGNNVGTNSGGSIDSRSYSEGSEAKSNAQQAQGQGQLQGQMQGNNNQIGGSTTQVKTGSTKTTYAPSSTVNNNFRRIPVATAVSMGQVAHTPYSCKPINGVGAQAPQFGVSASFSRDDKFCEGMVMAEVITQHYNMPKTGCLIVVEVAKNEHDDLVAKAMKISGESCMQIVPVVNGKAAVVGAAFGVPSATARDTEARLDSLRPINPSISAIHSSIMRK